MSDPLDLIALAPLPEPEPPPPPPAIDAVATEPPSSSIPLAPPELRMVDDVLVTVRQVQAFVDGTVLTAVEAPLGGGDRLSAWIGPGSYFIAAFRQDLRLGHRAFDDRYIVKTGDPALLRYWLDDDELDAILPTYDPHAVRPVRLELGEGLVRFVGHPTRLDTCVAVAARLARRGRRLADAWRTRVAPLGGVPSTDVFDTDGSFVITFADRRAALTLRFPETLPGVRRRGLRTVVAAARYQPRAETGALWGDALPRADRPPGAKLGGALRVGGLHGVDRPARWLGAAVGPIASALTVAAPDAVTIEEASVELRWERIVEDVAQLRAAMAIVEELANPRHHDAGPYR